jgi:hypothetical protein
MGISRIYGITIQVILPDKIVDGIVRILGIR